ncbi:hypothetical protein SEPCBS57363_001099 [Sporothrix epigloea]|uniref:Zn(2)-C6 fungal-type domain-containing protein n=1 Tax=Sporothrix epigloea TaxID=1892477 RepID=A0ABP0D8M2_9PEZI
MTRVKPGERKRARKPKVRSGCPTCNVVRKVKCDEARPACIRCVSTGRICDGYDNQPDGRCLVLAHRPSGAAAGDRMSMTGAASTIPSASIYTISPVSYGDALEARSLLFFKERTISQLQTFFPDDFWNSRILQLALSQDCIRHAVVSLSIHHERYMRLQNVSGRANGSADTSVSDADRAFALKQYNLAIRSLLECKDPTEALQIHLVSCLIFICIESLQGEIRSAIRLFKHGLSMIKALQSREVETAAAPEKPSLSSEGGTPAHVSSQSLTGDHVTDQFVSQLSSTTFSLSDNLISAVVAFLGRFSVQVSLLAGDIDPELHIGIIASASPQPKLSSTARFQTLLEARESIMNLAIHILSGAPHARIGDGFLESAAQMLGWWTIAFDRLAEERGPHLSKRGVALLELHKRYLTAHLKVPKTDYMMLSAGHVEEFAALVSLAERTLQSDTDGHDGSRPTHFHMDLGVVPVMFGTVLRCWDPVVRRRALTVLRNHRLQEGIWDSCLTLRAAERIVMLEDSSVSVLAAGTPVAPQRVKTVTLQMDSDEKTAKLHYGLGNHTFQEVLNW